MSGRFAACSRLRGIEHASASAGTHSLVELEEAIGGADRQESPCSTEIHKGGRYAQGWRETDGYRDLTAGPDLLYWRLAERP